MKEIDLNDFVSVRLTKSGAEILNEHNHKDNILYGVRLKDDYKENDIYKEQFWRVLSHFKYGIAYNKPFILLVG